MVGDVVGAIAEILEYLFGFSGFLVILILVFGSIVLFVALVAYGILNNSPFICSLPE